MRYSKTIGTVNRISNTIGVVSRMKRHTFGFLIFSLVLAVSHFTSSCGFITLPFSSSCSLSLCVYFKFFCNTKVTHGICFCGFSSVILLLDFVCLLNVTFHYCSFIGVHCVCVVARQFLFNIDDVEHRQLCLDLLLWQSVSELSFHLKGSVCFPASMLQFGSWMLFLSYVSLAWGHADGWGECLAGAENVLFCGPKFCLLLEIKSLIPTRGMSNSQDP